MWKCKNCGEICVSEDESLFLRSVIFSSMEELSKEDGFDIDINDIINRLKEQ